MIRRWLARLLAWAFADYFAKVARSLDVIDARLIALQNRVGISTAVPEPPAPREWHCGHTHVSGVIDHSGVSECVDCHQEEFRR